MLRYIARRLLLLPPLLVVITFIAFFLIRSAPGDPVTAIVGEKASRQERERVRRELGLDRPMPVQYAIWLGRAVRGDLGESAIRPGSSIASEIAACLPRTVELTLAALALAVTGGLLIGVLAAVFRGTIFDYAGMTVAVLGVSIPVFWLGLILILLLGSTFSSGQQISPELTVRPVTRFLLLDCVLRGDLSALANGLRHLVLPACTLATIPLSIIARISRASMLDVLGSDYVRTARAKGLPPWRVVGRHAFQNALVPVVTVVGLEFGYLLGGAVLTEKVFQWPGMGSYMFDAVMDRENPALLGAIAVFCGAFVLVNLGVDVLYHLLDRRIRAG